MMDMEFGRKLSAQEAYIALYGSEDLEDMPSWIEALNVPEHPTPEFPHSQAHIEMVKKYTLFNARALGLPDAICEKACTAAALHDLGMAFVEQGLVPIDEHHHASEIISVMLTGDPDIGEIVWLHNQESLRLDDSTNSNDILLAARALRDADRLALMGYSGLVRKAYYLGWRSPEMDFDFQDQQDSQALFDLRITDDGLPEDLDTSVKEHLFKNLLPFLLEKSYENGGIWDTLLNGQDENLYRFFGRNRYEQGLVEDIVNDMETRKAFQKGKLVLSSWIVRNMHRLDLKLTDGIHEQYQGAYIQKLILDYEISKILGHLRFLQRSNTKSEYIRAAEEYISSLNHA